ncbi:MAG: hypothetical protein GX197_05725 [Firmicutes bacterium]|nr:hypothetical protein [Bacillota bacterium]
MSFGKFFLPMATEASLIWLKTYVSDGDSAQALYLNEKQLSFFGLAPGKKIILQIGSIKKTVALKKQTIDATENIFYLSKKLFKYFPFSFEQPLLLYFYQKNIICLGPSVGITIKKRKLKDVKKKSILVKRSLLAKKYGILFYYFNLEDVNWQQNLVRAFQLNHDGTKWLEAPVPVPQVIYDLGSYPKPETVKSFTKRGSVSSLLWLNKTRTISKYKAYLALKSSQQTKLSVPETAPLNGTTLANYLEKYDFCYLKPNFGRNGRHVYRIQKSKKGFICQAGGSKVKSYIFPEIKDVLRFIKNKQKNFIIQQGITLSRLGNRPFDMRVLMQKHSNQNWLLSAVNFRIARPEAVVTNFAQGASDKLVLPGEKLLHDALTWEELNRFCLNVILVIDKFFGPLGEIGLDVALDHKGKLWLLEVNTRPSSIAYRNADDATCEKIFGAPFKYAISLLRRNLNANF